MQGKKNGIEITVKNNTQKPQGQNKQQSVPDIGFFLLFLKKSFEIIQDKRGAKHTWQEPKWTIPCHIS